MCCCCLLVLRVVGLVCLFVLLFNSVGVFLCFLLFEFWVCGFSFCCLLLACFVLRCILLSMGLLDDCGYLAVACCLFALWYLVEVV